MDHNNQIEEVDEPLLQKKPTTTGAVVVDFVRRTLVQVLSCLSVLCCVVPNYHKGSDTKTATHNDNNKMASTNADSEKDDACKAKKEDDEEGYIMLGERKRSIPNTSGKATTSDDTCNVNAGEEEDDDDVVEVYILMGQSNMLGMGHVGSKADVSKDGTLQCAVHQKGLYPYLIGSDGNWTTSPTVRNVRVMQWKGNTMRVFKNEFLTIKEKETIGPEIGIGHELEQSRAGKKVMLLKSCIGNRSLGWDLLPPGSQEYNYKGETYAGYKETPDHWPADKPKPAPIKWYAGKQYDDDTANAKTVLHDIPKYYPTATKYKIVGFFWWQGDKDRYCEAHATHYESNLVRLIHKLRADFNAPDAKFVVATLGQDVLDQTTGNDKYILDALMAVDGSKGKYPEFVGNVSTVYTHPLSKGGSSNGHYNGNAETYMNVGQAMGKAMAELVPSGSK